MVAYFFLRFMILLVRVMPFGMMYAFSDFVYLIIYHVVGYRKKVVVTNLSQSFPQKSSDEIRLMTKKFFHHLCDISLESLKGFSMRPDEIISRHHILNPETADQFYDKGVSIITVPGHYNNWEWGSLSPGLQIKFPIVAFYKPLSNKRVDLYIKQHRAKFHTLLASIKETALTFESLAHSTQGYIMAADQNPTNMKECYWIDFLQRDTAWLHGPEKYSRKYNFPVLYVDIQKVKRGYYELKLVVLTENPALLPNGEITRMYVEQLEKSICKEPAYWLWSHRRWKNGRS